MKKTSLLKFLAFLLASVVVFSPMAVFAQHTHTESGLCSCSGVVINENNFPDRIFREYVDEFFDTDNDSFLTVDELANVTDINTTAACPREITSMQGVEFFTELRNLDCRYNEQLTSLDVSKNTELSTLYCDFNNITSLDVSNNTALRRLSCGNNNLTSLDVSNNTALLHLSCSVNNIASLDVSNNTALSRLSCDFNNISSLDVSNNIQLMTLTCSINNLTSLDVSNNTALITLRCYDNNLTSLDVSKNTALMYLSCTDNNLTSLDVSKNTALEEVNCDYNKLTCLDVSNNTALTRLGCGNNNLTSLDVSKNTELETLYCWYNNLTSLDLSNNVNINHFLVKQQINVTIDTNNMTIDLAELDSNFDSTKVSNVYGGTLDGTRLTCSSTTYTKYTYDTGADGVGGMEVLFFVTVVDSSEIDDGKVSATIGSEITKKMEELNEKDELKQGIDINLPTVNLGFDLKALLNMIFQSMGKDITVFTHMTDIFSLNTAQQNSMYGMGVMSVVSLEVNAGGIKISQFGGDVLVGVPFTLPAGEKAENYEIIYIADNGKQTPMETEYKDGYLWFVTEHFSDYAVVNKNGAGASAKLGDLTGDGKLNSFDYLLVRSYILGLTTFTNAQLSAADVNQDGNINSFDYLLMRAHILGLTTIKGW